MASYSSVRGEKGRTKHDITERAENNSAGRKQENKENAYVHNAEMQAKKIDSERMMIEKKALSEPV